MGDVMTLRPEADTTEQPVAPARTVLVVEDGRRLSRTFQYICDYLNLPMTRVRTDADLGSVLQACQPLAIVCELDGGAQDGCHVMKLVAAHDRGLPFLLVTGDDHALIGAADAVEELCGLANVRKLQEAPGLGDVVEFLLGAGRFGGTPYLRAA